MDVEVADGDHRGHGGDLPEGLCHRLECDAELVAVAAGHDVGLVVAPSDHVGLSRGVLERGDHGVDGGSQQVIGSFDLDSDVEVAGRDRFAYVGDLPEGGCDPLECGAEHVAVAAEHDVGSVVALSDAVRVLDIRMQKSLSARHVGAKHRDRVGLDQRVERIPEQRHVVVLRDSLESLDE